MNNLRSKSLVILLLFVQNNPFAQIIVTNTETPETLVEDVLIGAGVTISNVEFNQSAADAMAIQPNMGYFNATTTTFLLEDGIILSTGNVAVAVGPNDTPDATDDTDMPIMSLFDENDLDDIASEDIFHKAVLEFDFVPNGDSIIFNYIFSSEEYLEFVDAGFNDVFGIFLSGPGYAGPFEFGAENIALIPGTTIPVGIDNVNDIDNPAYYVNNDGGTDVQFDGYTTVLSSTAIVECGETYHIKFAIGDAGDNLYDSGIFISGESFTSDASEEINLEAYTFSDITTESCDSVLVEITRTEIPEAEELTVTLDISGTAENGIDYSLIPDEITFPEGVYTVPIWIFPFADGSLEGTETIILAITYLNDCGDPVVNEIEIEISDLEPLILAATDTILYCPTDLVLIDVDIEGGTPDYQFEWDTGETEAEIWVPGDIEGTSTYNVTVTDACGQTETISMDVTLNLIGFDLNADDVTLSCPLDSIEIGFIIAGGTPEFDILWNTGDDQANIWVPANITGTETYTVEVTDACGQTGTTSIDVIFDPIGFDLNADNIILDCPTDSVEIGFIIAGGTPEFDILWNTGDDQINIWVPANVAGTETYTVEVTDACGNEGTTSIDVTVIETPFEIITIDITLFCPTDSVLIGAVIAGGTPEFDILWNTGDDQTNIWVPASTTGTQTYTIEVTDACGIEETNSIDVTIIAVPIEVITTDTTIYCPIDSLLIDAEIDGGTPDYEFEWNTGETEPEIWVPGNIEGTTSYSVDVLDACGQMGTATLDVTFTPIGFDLNADDITLFCPTDSVEIGFVIAGGTPEFDILWDTGDDQANIWVPTNTVGTETYTVAVTDACGSEGTTSIDVTVVETPLEIIVSDTTIYCGTDFLLISPEIETGTPEYTFEWSTTETASEILVPGNIEGTTTYTVNVTDACGQTDVADINITYIPIGFDLNADDVALGCPMDSVEIGFTIAGGTPEFDILWNTGDDETNIWVPANTIGTETYTVSVTDACGNEGTTSIDVTVFAIPFEIITNDTTINCPTDSLLISAIIEGGTPDYEFEWSTAETESEIWVPGNIEGTITYNVNVTDACGQTETNIININYIPIGFDLNADDVTLLCPTDSIEIGFIIVGGTPTFDILWNTGADQTDIMVPANTAGTITYSADVVDACGIENSISIDVTIIELPFEIITNDTTIYCATDSLLISTTIEGGTPEFEFEWSTGETESEIWVPGNIEGITTYEIEIIDACGQNGTRTIEVNYIPIPFNLNADDVTLICPTDSIEIGIIITGGTPEFDVLWNTGDDQTTIWVPANTAGTETYSVDITDACGIERTTNIDVTVIETPFDITTIDTTTYCATDSLLIGVVMEGGTPEFDVLWSNGETTSNIWVAGDSIGISTYEVTVEDACGMQEVGNINVTLIEIPFELVSSDTLITCPTDSLLIAFEIEGGTPEFQIEWGTGENEPGIWVSGETLDTTSYSVSVTDACEQTASTIINVILDPIGPPIITLGDTLLVCKGESITIAPDVTGEDLPTGYLWEPTGATTIDLTTEPTENSWYTLIVYGSCFSTTDSAYVEIIELSETEFIVGETCIDDCTGSISIEAEGGVDPYTYSIDDCFTISFDEMYTGLCAGEYSVCVSDSMGCVITSNVEIPEGTSYETITISAPDSLCEDHAIIEIFTDLEGGTFIGSGITENQFDPSIAGPGEHTIYYTSDGPCPTTDSTQIIVNPNPIVSFIGDTLNGCAPISVNFSNTGTITDISSWSFGDGFTATNCNETTHTYSNVGTFDVCLIVINEHGCTNSDTYENYIETYNTPVADFFFDPNPASTLNPTINYTDNSFGASEWKWNFNDFGASTDQDPSFTFPPEAGNYNTTLEVTSPFGCTDIKSQTLTIEAPFQIYVPNVFTPDGDNFNEEFMPVISGTDINNYELTIFNRWGEIIFESQDLNVGWDGTFKNKGITSDGVYIWQISVSDLYSPKIYTYTGHVTLLK